MKDFLQALDKVHKTSVELFDQGYRDFSFDVKSLFTNVSISKIINVMLDRVFKEKLTDVKLRKNTFIRLLHKMHSLSTVLFTKQKDGTSMDHSLEPVFAKVYMAKIKRKIAKTLTKYGLLKLYIGYLNDTFLSAKVKRYNFLKSNSFHNNLQFAPFRLEQENGIFLDIYSNLHY